MAIGVELFVRGIQVNIVLEYGWDRGGSDLQYIFLKECAGATKVLSCRDGCQRKCGSESWTDGGCRDDGT